jgi:hypothetical protein
MDVVVANDGTSTSIHNDRAVKPSTESHFFDSALINHKLQGYNI